NDLHDATINIQAFVFNIFGAIDNLALIWVTETELKQKNGQALPSSWIGLGPKNSFVRESLPQAVRDHLESMNSWFENLENFRHALAHRVPLYIPPYTVDPKKVDEWQQFESEIADAERLGDTQTKVTLEERQMVLCKFRPWMVHSYSERSH